jgi:hypothetical protein
MTPAPASRILRRMERESVGRRWSAAVARGWRQGPMHFHFLLTNHYPYGVYKIEDHVKLIAGGLAALGHKVTFGFDDDVVPWPGVNLLVEFFNRSPVVDQVIALKASRTRYAFGLICHEDLQDAVMDEPDFPDRRTGLERLLPHMDFVWTAVPSDYTALAGGERVRYLEYGHVPSLRRANALTRDIDVLFYGFVGERRAPVFGALVQRGLRVAMTTGILPGYFKNDLLDRARVVADVRRSEQARFLAPSRLCTVLHAGVAIVVERFDAGPLSRFYPYTANAPMGEFVDLCERVARADQCLALGDAARTQFAADTSMAASLRRVMDLPVFEELGGL